MHQPLRLSSFDKTHWRVNLPKRVGPHWYEYIYLDGELYYAERLSPTDVRPVVCHRVGISAAGPTIFFQPKSVPTPLELLHKGDTFIDLVDWN